jgi:hypothetical protein
MGDGGLGGQARVITGRAGPNEDFRQLKTGRYWIPRSLKPNLMVPANGEPTSVLCRPIPPSRHSQTTAPVSPRLGPNLFVGWERGFLTFMASARVLAAIAALILKVGHWPSRGVNLALTKSHQNQVQMRRNRSSAGPAAA